MSKSARITLSATDVRKLEQVCEIIKAISERTSVGMSGPVPLPTRHLRVPVRKGPDGAGTSTIDHWELRIHKRLIDLDADDKALRQIIRIPVPDGVTVEIVMTK